MTKSRTGNVSKPRRWLEIFLLSAGIAGLGIWAASKAIPAIWQAWENRAFDTASKSSPGRGSKTPRPATGSVVGRLSISRLQISSMVREGDDDVTLSLALGHIPSTAMPGQAGNVGVAGHRDALFRGLQGIRKDDQIRFETLAGSHLYQVDSIKIVKPEDVSVLKSTQEPELTLVTCYPFHYIGSAPDRFIVSAHEIPSTTPEPVLQEVRRQEVRDENVGQRTGVGEKTGQKLDRTPGIDRAPADTAGMSKVTFTVLKHHGQEIAPDISIGVSDTGGRRVNGWMWLKHDHRTVFLKDEPVGKPKVFYQDGKRCELLITSVSGGSVKGSLFFTVD